MQLNLFYKKTVESLLEQASSGKKQDFERSLGVVNLTSLGIGAIIGAGIFVLTGQAAAKYAGPSITISFILAAFACLFSGLCYAEFASMIPIAGSAYTYAYVTLGEIVAWTIGWNLILEYIFCAGTIAVGWSGYLVSVLKDIGILIPETFVNSPFNLAAVFIVAAMTLFLIFGIRQSALLNNIIVAVKVTVILLFIFFGCRYINPENWTPFIPENTGEFGSYGWSGVLRGAGVIFFSYLGFDSISSVAQEAKNPQRDMPIAILASLLISTLLYVGVALVLTGIIPYQLLNVPDPIAVGVNAVGDGLQWLRPLIKLGAIAGLSSAILTAILAQSRIFYAMAKDNLLPSLVASVHPQLKTPHIATILSGFGASLCAGLLPINILGELVSIGTLLAFLFVCVAVLILRKTQPDTPRPFKTPWVPFVPVMGILTSGVEMLALSIDTWLRLIAWLTIGFVIYFAYGKGNRWRLAELEASDLSPDFNNVN
jgi:basic amino acid/polyamine antiporter, APA family